MSVWFVALKAALPYVTSIVSAAIPAFTARKNAEKSPEVVGQQIVELQEASTKNAESVKVLAEQLQRTVTAVEEGVTSLEQRLNQFREELTHDDQTHAALKNRVEDLDLRFRQMRSWALVAVVIAIVSLATAIVVLTR